MPTKPQVLQIEPLKELTFTGPFTQSVSSYIKLNNPSHEKVYFKIKTTAPKRYCVKPNRGVLYPRDKIAIAVGLQPFEYDPAEKNKHKFMVQSMFADDSKGCCTWDEVDETKLMDSKLSCVFVMPAISQKVKSNSYKMGSDVAEISQMRQENIALKVVIRDLFTKLNIAEICTRNIKLINLLTKSIEEKEAALECPVCLDTAKAPIFTCQQQHLVCNSCLPRLTSCPECREDYPGPPRRHRYAERDAEELEKMIKELAKLLN